MKQFNNNCQWTKETIKKYLESIDYLESKSCFTILNIINNKRISKLISRLNKLDQYKYTALALMKACECYPDFVPNLLKHPNLDINIRNNNGQTALMLACQYKSNIVSRLLINSNTQNTMEWNDLVMDYTSSSRIISELLSHPDILLYIKNNNKETVFDFSQQCNNNSCKIIKNILDNNKLRNKIQSRKNKKFKIML